MPYVREKKVPGKDGKTYSYYQLVEGKRVDGKVRQHVIAHLGKHDSIEAARAAAVGVVPKKETQEARPLSYYRQVEATPVVEESPEESDSGFSQISPETLKGDDEVLRKLRKRLRSAARARHNRYLDIIGYTQARGGFDALSADEWAKAEEIEEEAGHLGGEADKITAELRRRRTMRQS